MSISKDSKIEDLRIDQKELLIQADLVAQTSEAPSLVSFSGVLATRTISVDIKEPVKSCQKVQIINRATGSNAAISAAPVISGNSISVTLNATGLSDVCICVDFKN
jgi:hypothetical protein